MSLLYAKTRDLNLRNKFLKLEKKIKLLKYVKINLISQFTRRTKKRACMIEAFRLEKKIFKQKRISRVQLVRRCVLTNRSRGVSRFTSISRSQLRDMMLIGLVPGYKKAVW